MVQFTYKTAVKVECRREVSIVVLIRWATVDDKVVQWGVLLAATNELIHRHGQTEKGRQIRQVVQVRGNVSLGEDLKEESLKILPD